MYIIYKIRKLFMQIVYRKQHQRYVHLYSLYTYELYELIPIKGINCINASNSFLHELLLSSQHNIYIHRMTENNNLYLINACKGIHLTEHKVFPGIYFVQTSTIGKGSTIVIMFLYSSFVLRSLFCLQVISNL